MRWKQTASGFKFDNPAEKLKVRIKTGAAGQARIILRAKGAANPVQYLPPLSAPIEVQLRTVEGVASPVTFSSVYFTPVKSTPEKYKSQNPHP